MVRHLFIILFSCSLYGFNPYPPLNVFDHPVSTRVEDAQYAFNQGLIAIYAFNYDAALENFQKAVDLDPELGMGYWGIALAYIEAEKTEKALPFFEKAQSLESQATPIERDYIEALGARFEKDPKINKHIAYRDAMKKLHQKYPDDPDAAVLYAESMMNLLKWRLWNKDLEPRDDSVKEILSTLENVMKKVTLHPGANHFYIHAVEGSKHPEWGLNAAENLKHFTDWGHLLHSSSHIYLRLGDYDAAIAANLNAIDADQKYLEGSQIVPYAMKYVTHSLFYLYKSYLWEEKKRETYETAENIIDFVTPHLTHIPQLEENLLVLMEAYLYFKNWDAILSAPLPDEKFKLATAFTHFARAKAFLAIGEREKAEAEERDFIKAKENFSYNKILDMAESELVAAFLKAKGDKKAYIEQMRKVVLMEDEMGLLDWYHQNRQTLGAFLLEEGEGEEAEKIFREADQRIPKNGRTLFGLFQALEMQKKDSYWIEREAKDALQGKSLKLSDL